MLFLFFVSIQMQKQRELIEKCYTCFERIQKIDGPDEKAHIQWIRQTKEEKKTSRIFFE